MTQADQPRPFEIDAIDEGILTRDRTGLDAGPLDELLLSICAHGLRQPVEIFPLEDHPGLAARARPGARWGLLSGFRRLACFRMRAEAGDARFAAIPAFLRRPTDTAAALVQMVEENEVRAELSPWERGRICVTARDGGVFATLDEAVDRLFASASRQKRHRIRQLALVADELDGQLMAPEALTLRHCLRLAEALRAGFGEVMRVALADGKAASAAAEWQILQPLVEEAEALRRDEASAAGIRRARRIAEPRPGIVVRRERTRAGYALHFTGHLVDSELMDTIFAEIDRMFAPVGRR